LGEKTMQASTSCLNRQFHRLKNGVASTSKAFDAEEKVRLRALERIGAKQRWKRMTPAQQKVYAEEKAKRTKPEDPGQYLQFISSGFQGSQPPAKDGRQSQTPYFDLGAFNQIFDVHPDLYSNPTDGVRTVQINDPAAPMLSKPSSSELASIEASSGSVGVEPEGDSLAALAADASNPFSIQQLRQLHRYPLVLNQVVNMTSKGKIPSMYALVVVGNGNGLVGFGEGKSENAQQANDRAFVQAVKNMDYVQRKDARTTWADLMSGKWCATTVELRSRPPGFGLRTSPIIHQIASSRHPRPFCKSPRIEE